MDLIHRIPEMNSGQVRMQKKITNSQKNKTLGRKLLFVLSLILLIFVGVKVGNETYRRWQIQKEIDSLKRDIAKVEKNNEELAELIEYYKTSSFLEKEARLKLNLKAPEEQVVAVPGNVSENTEIPKPSNEPPKNESGQSEQNSVSENRQLTGNTLEMISSLEEAFSKKETNLDLKTGERISNPQKWWNYFFGKK